jgi:NAD(P)-dependent dehydrogenase (short-subunit alcohol dehydrogenase family)
VETVAARVLERHPAIGLLVNNAGIPARCSFLGVDPDRVEEVLRVNYLGSVWCLRAFLPGLEAAAPSDVVNVVSVAGAVAWGPSGPYCASKHAQLAFSRAAAADLAPRGIRVHTILPGFVETEGFPQTQLQGTLLGRAVAQPDAVVRRALQALDRNRREVYVPRWYRLAAVAQGVAPGLLARAIAGRRRRPAT